MIEEKTLKTLEYYKILHNVSCFAHSDTAKQYILCQKPQNDIIKVKQLLNETFEADKIIFEHIVSINFAFDNIQDALDSAEKLSILNISQIMKIGKVLKVARNIKHNIEKINDNKICLLREITRNLYINADFEDNISKSFLNDSEVNDEASSNLMQIRKNIRECNQKIKQKLLDFISKSNYTSLLQDNIVTIRNNRYVVPLKSECKGQISGLIHDQSSSGATLFVEPMVIVDLNNQLRALQLQESSEIEAILTNFTYSIYQQSNGISRSFFEITKLDSIFARAQYSRSINGILPKLNDKGLINILSGRHPLIDKKKIVPVSIKLGYKYDIMVITGPNTGGKTVTLKLVGLLSLMAMSGLFIPADYDSEISVFDNIFCDIGDEQNIEENLSTFSSHLANLVHITKNLTSNSLLLLDELGAGTDPIEGSALAISFIEFFKEYKCKVLTTSHYNELKEYSFTTQNVSNASMDFDPNTYMPTYKLIMGLSGSSNALAIASNLGVNDKIINKAKSMLTQEKISFDKIIESAEKARRDAIKIKEQAQLELHEITIEKLKAKELTTKLQLDKEKLDKKLKKGLKELLIDYAWEAEELLNQLKEKVKIGNEQAFFEARTLKKRLENFSITQNAEKPSFKILDNEINVGDKIYIKSLNAIGSVVSINEKRKEYATKVGILTTNIKQNDAQKVIAEDFEEQPKLAIKKTFSNIACPLQINLIGQSCEDAIFNVDKYLSDAVLQGYSEVTIVHGKGTGALRKALHDFFKSHLCIESFRLGNYGEGETGVTIVTLK